jgi:hypothetical protein
MCRITLLSASIEMTARDTSLTGRPYTSYTGQPKSVGYGVSKSRQAAKSPTSKSLRYAWKLLETDLMRCDLRTIIDSEK